LYLYVDDSFSFEQRKHLEYYQCYKKFLPRNLACLLHLWDHLGILHEERKQVFVTFFGSPLPIIGFEVDPNLMKVQMSDTSRVKLIEDIQEFAQHGTCRALGDFQKIVGYLNWALNVYPLLRPGLTAIYTKTAGKVQQRAPIWLNKDVERELVWLANHLRKSDGIYFLKSVSWS
ncbi:hypothetical protein PAXRUDRAFT_92671, partial [Paxillus rubicundulus Ve08.2h10]